MSSSYVSELDNIARAVNLDNTLVIYLLLYLHLLLIPPGQESCTWNRVIFIAVSHHRRIGLKNLVQGRATRTWGGGGNRVIAPAPRKGFDPPRATQTGKHGGRRMIMFARCCGSCAASQGDVLEVRDTGGKPSPTNK